MSDHADALARAAAFVAVRKAEVAASPPSHAATPDEAIAALEAGLIASGAIEAEPVVMVRQPVQQQQGRDRRPLQSIDPTIRTAAASLIVEAMGAIESAVLAGTRFHTARDAFLAANVDSWVRTCGRECADQALRGLCALDESEVLSAQAKAIMARRWKADRLRFLEFTDKHRNTLLNRISIHLFGLPAY